MCHAASFYFFVCFCVLKIFLKKFKFFFKLIFFLVFLNHFIVLILKIILKNNFNAFPSKKHFKKQPQPYSQTR